MKELIRDVASRGVVGLRLSALGRGVGEQQGTLILYGHRFSHDDEGYLQGLRPQWLDEQLAYLTRHYEIISLQTLVGCLEGRKTVPARSVVLTFDDGFRDNLEHALPILERYRVPASVFVVTRSLSLGELPWSQRLGIIFQSTAKTWVAHRLLGDRPWPLADEGQRRAAYQAVKVSIASMGRSARDATIDRLAGQLDVEPPRDRMLNWEDARLLLARGIEIGGHGYSHALLGKVSMAEARDEIRRCKEDLREHLGLERPGFCLPGGSFREEVLRCVRLTGFGSCFIPNQHKRRNRSGDTTPYTLSRLGLPNAPAYHLEAELDGPFHRFRQCYHRVVQA